MDVLIYSFYFSGVFSPHLYYVFDFYTPLKIWPLKQIPGIE